MRSLGSRSLFALIATTILLTSCASQRQDTNYAYANSAPQMVAPPTDYASRLPQNIATSEKTIVVDPNVHAWGAYNSQGELVKAGLVTAGGNWCSDVGRSCRTKSGSFRIASLGGPSCKSSLYPLPRGGAPMPYCMFFNGNQGLHGSSEVIEGNVSHGCVRMRVSDAEWVRYNFANVGTRVIVRPY
jgi:lipoprotein-anchoring transpeptidase ErfK/SrfK